MMKNRFGNFGNSDIGFYYRSLYSNNKVLIWISGGSLVAMLLTGSDFFNSFFMAYLLFISSVLYKQFYTIEKLIYTMVFSFFAGIGLYLALFANSLKAEDALAVGIGSAAFGVLSSAATYAPNSEINLAFFGRIKLKWIALFIIGLDLLTVNFTSISPRICHLGGVLYGFLSVYFISKSGFADGKFDFLRFKKRGPYYKKPNKDFYNPSQASKENDEQYNERKNLEQKEIDAILEKIKMSGYETLSTTEKKRLFDQSKR